MCRIDGYPERFALPPSSRLIPRDLRLCRVVLGVALVATTAFGAAPAQLRPAVQLLDNGVALCPGSAGSGYAIPCVTDWNGDGKQDLLVGYQLAGKIALYLNQGSREAPCFTNFTNLKAAGQNDIAYPSGGCGAPAPWVCDFDNDGDRDLLVGAGADGTVWLHRNTNSDAAPLLDRGEQLRTGGSVLSVGQRATPTTCDWDEDGLADLLCGAGDGFAYFFKNTNTATQPVFAPGTKLKAAGLDLNVGIRSVLRAHDWDGDGVRDLVCSSDAGVYWYRGTRGAGAILLGPRESLCAPVALNGLVPINTGGRMRLHLTDWNNDGVPDLLLGNLNGTVTFFEGYPFRLDRIDRIGNEVSLVWQSAPFLRYRVLAGPTPDALTNIIGSQVISEGKATHWRTVESGSSLYYRVQVE